MVDIERSFFTSLDATPTPVVATSLGIDVLRFGGLAAIPIPEPGTAPLGAAAFATLLALRRATRRGSFRRRRPERG